MAIKHGVKKYTGFDITCQLLAVFGIIVWQLSDNPSLGVIFALVVFIIASLPTWHHAWLQPYAETWQGFAIGAFGSLMTIVIVTQISFIALAFPVTITLNCGLTAAIILMRRRATRLAHSTRLKAKSSLLDPAR
jgi:hypothetical protein